MSRTSKRWADKDLPMAHSSVSVLEDRVHDKHAAGYHPTHTALVLSKEMKACSHALSTFTPASHLRAQNQQRPH